MTPGVGIPISATLFDAAGEQRARVVGADPCLEGLDRRTLFPWDERIDPPDVAGDDERRDLRLADAPVSG